MKIQFAGKLPTPIDEVPLPDADVICTKPVQRGYTATVDGDMSSGSWSSEGGEFHWTYYVDETVYIIKGEAMILEHGTHAVVHVEAGDVVHFKKGARALWNVENYIEKFWVIRAPKRSLVSRICRRLMGSQATSQGESK